MKRARFSIALVLAGCVSWSPVWAAHVEGLGLIETSLSDPEFASIETAYEDPVFLDVGRSVQLTASQVGGSGNKTFQHLGEAQVGRLRARAYIGGPVFAMPELNSGVYLRMEFYDQITPESLNPLAVRYLRMDVELRGVMTRQNLTLGNATNARFAINMEGVESGINTGLYSVNFSWFADGVFISEVIPQTGWGTPRFVPYPGEEARFTNTSSGGVAEYSFSARGYLDVPLDEDEEEGPPGLLFGEPFQLRVSTIVDSSCDTEPACLSVVDFSTARVNNARFVDQNGDPAQGGGSFTSESGYDYSLPVPEPETFAMQLIALGSLGFATHRRRRHAA